MGSEIIGYIVTTKEGPMCLTKYEDNVEVLCCGEYAHVFPTRRAANRVVERTRAYVERHKLTAWETSYEVWRLEQ